MSLPLNFLRFLTGRGPLFASVGARWDALCMESAIRTAVWQSRGRGEGHLWFLSAPLTLCHSRRRVVIRDFAKSSSQQGLQENHGHRLCPRTAALGGLHHNSSNYRQKREYCSTSDIRSHDIYSSSSFSGPAPSRHPSPMPADPCASIWKRYWLLNCLDALSLS